MIVEKNNRLINKISEEENLEFNKFYNKYINYSSDYVEKFANHMPMVAYALYELGESLEVIDEYVYEFIDKNNVREENLTIKYEININNFKDYLGVEDSIGSYYNFFKNDTVNKEVKTLIKLYLPILIEGCAARAFHPLIRLGYSIRNNNYEEVVRSLSYFSATFLKNNCEKKPKVTKNIINDLDNIYELFRNENLEGNFINKIEKIYSQEMFKNNIFSLGNNCNEILENLDKIINSLYLNLGGFILLHAVTSKEAIKTLLPYVENKKELLDNYWMAIIAAYITVAKGKARNFEVDIPDNLPRFDEIIIKSINTKNEHTIKLTNSCRIEYANSGDEIYKYIACIENGMFK